MPAHREQHVGAGFLPARTLRVGNQDVRASRAQVGNLRLRGRSKSKAQVGKPAATGTASEASAPRDTRRCRFFTCTNATGRKPGRVCEQSAGRKTCGYGARSKSTRAPVSRPPNSSSRNAWLPRLDWRFSGVNAESLRVRPQRVIRCKHPWRVSRRHAMPVLGVAMNSRSRP